MEAGDIAACARMATDSEIGKRYGFSQDGMAATLSRALAAGTLPEASERLFVAIDGTGKILGFAWIDLTGAFSSAPYLRLIAVDPLERGSGVGALLLEEFELKARSVGRDCCLLVSDFNTKARAFYARHGYQELCVLPDFARPGIGEVFMLKPRKAHAP